MSNARFVVVVLVLAVASFVGVRTWLDWKTAATDPRTASPGLPTAIPKVTYLPIGELRPTVPASAARPPTRQELDRFTHDHFRDAALQALRRQGPELCGAVERGNFLATLNQYYTHRDKALHGIAGLSRAEQVEVERAWSTPGDLQIDGLVREFYTEGYMRPGDLQTSPTLEQVLAGVKPRHQVCANAGRG